MRVRAKVDHFNDYSINGAPGIAVGEDRLKKKGAEYEIPVDAEAQLLIDAETVEKAGAKK